MYSTCTLNQIENEEVIKKTLEAFGDQISLERSKKYRPHRDHTGGFFVAKIQKHSSIKPQNIQQSPKIPLFDTSNKLQFQVRELLKKDF
ncbi:TPA: hypothetical protein DEP21_02395 [Patescibacteria group bacterium]|nr:hypothetical protein [Candidatus Gracilibacteria bacterium]